MQFHILKVSESSDDIDKKQDDHADADKQSGYAGNEINRNRFYRDTYDGCQQPQKKKPVWFAAAAVHINKQMDKYNDKYRTKNDLSDWKRFNIVCNAEKCQNRTDSEIQKRQTPEDGIQSAMKLLLDTVCIEQNRNRTQKNHDKAERTQSGGIWN